MKWSDEDIQYIKRNYKKKSLDHIAKKVGRSKAACATYAYKHGLDGSWCFTELQKAFIENHVGVMSYQEMADRTGRTYASIKSYIYKNGLSPMHNGEYRLTITEVSRLVGINRMTIDRNWQKRGLVFYKVGKHKMVEIENLLEVMKNNTDIWIPSKCEKWYFQNYDWFQKEREKENKKMIKERWGQYA